MINKHNPVEMTNERTTVVNKHTVMEEVGGKQKNGGRVFRRHNYYWLHAPHLYLKD